MSQGRRRYRWQRSLPVLPVLFLLAALPGCAGASLPRSGQAQETAAEVEQLKARVLELQRRASVTEVELERLRREVARLGGASAPAAAAPPRAAAPRPVPRVEPPPRPIPAPRPSPAVEIEDIQPQENPPTAVEESPRARPGAGATGGGAQAEVSSAAQAVYDRGYTLYHQGRYVDAEAGFQRFLQAYPDTELADNALYWIGESRLARGDQRGALAAFEETAERYPNGNKVPDALLKAGESLAALGDGEGARELYRAVIERFAGTTAAAVARDRLEALP